MMSKRHINVSFFVQQQKNKSLQEGIDFLFILMYDVKKMGEDII